MAELITEEQPRIKFGCEWVGACDPLTPDTTPELARLLALCQRMEALGAAPVLNDGLVGGNAGLLVDLPGQAAATLFVTRSGKPPAHVMSGADFVAVERFDEDAWTAHFRSSNPAHRPTSDTPLLAACLTGGGSSSGAAHQWSSQPRVALHGHALAEGAGLEAARRLGLPISEHPTLFSTPEDLGELRKLFHSHPYPQHRCFIRQSHGFFILGESVAAAEEVFEEVVVPHLSL